MKPDGIDLFKVAGIQIAIDHSWIVIFLLVFWSLSAGYFPHEDAALEPPPSDTKSAAQC